MVDLPGRHDADDTTAQLVDIITNGYFFRHSLKTPLTALQLALDCLGAANLSPTDRDHLQAARAASHRISQLLAATYPQQSPQHHQFELQPSIQAVVNLLRTHNHVILTHLPDQTLYLTGNQFLFEEAVVCLVTNALESYQPQQRRHVLITARQDSDQLHLNIIDGGSGMAISDRAAVWQPTYTTKSDPQQQRGHGLHIVNQIITNHFGGQIDLESQPNRGTRVQVKLPIAT